VLAGLAVLGNASLELSSTGSDNEDTAVSLGGTSDHVLDEISMAGSVNDGDVELGSLELPESDVDGDTTLTLSLQLVQNPSVLEGALAHLKTVNWQLIKTLNPGLCTQSSRKKISTLNLN
jgi:hypothetical protein